MLGERLDAQLDEARDGIGRRVEQAGVEAQLQTLDDRYAMLRAEAAFDHNDPDKIESLAMVAEQAAAHEARLGGHDDPGALASERRNAVWRSAIEANLAKGQPREALALYDRSKGSLGEAMTTEMKDVATDVEAEDWVRRQEGAPTQETADAALADPDLSPAARLRAYQKVQADIAGRENARVAEVERLDAAVASTTKTLATDPSRYRRGTLASLADGYQKAGETDTAAMLRAQAEQESFLRGYAQSPAQAQQRILASLPESVDRTLLEQIGKHQAEAFAKDPWSAGTSIYPDVGAPKPPSDLPGRMDQARLISRHRGGIEVLPFSGGEIATLRKNIPAAPAKEQTDTLKELAKMLPPEILPPLASALAGKNGSDDFQSRSLAGALSFHADGAPEIADQVLRGAKLTQEKGDLGKPVIATTPQWKEELQARIGDNAAASPIIRDTIANIYTHNAERAGQGDEIDTDLLDKAIDITKGNAAKQPAIMIRAGNDAMPAQGLPPAPGPLPPPVPGVRGFGPTLPGPFGLPGKMGPLPANPSDGNNGTVTPGPSGPADPVLPLPEFPRPVDPSDFDGPPPDGFKGAMRTPYTRSPETFAQRDNNVMPARVALDPIRGPLESSPTARDDGRPRPMQITRLPVTPGKIKDGGAAPGAPATEPTPGSPEYQAADKAARRFLHQSDLKELKRLEPTNPLLTQIGAADGEPDPVFVAKVQDELEQARKRRDARAKPVTLPDGSTIPNRFSPTGVVRGPENNLADVAAEGRRIYEYHLEMERRGQVGGEAEAYRLTMIGLAVGHAGTYDYQREGSFLKGYIQHPQYRDVANVNVGLLCQQAGLTLEMTLIISGRFARFFSSNWDPKAPYGLDPRTAEFIRKG